MNIRERGVKSIYRVQETRERPGRESKTRFDRRKEKRMRIIATGVTTPPQATCNVVIDKIQHHRSHYDVFLTGTVHNSVSYMMNSVHRCCGD